MFDPNCFNEKNNKKYFIKFCHSKGHIPFNPFVSLTDKIVKAHGGEITTLYFETEAEKRAFEIGLMYRNCSESFFVMDEDKQKPYNSEVSFLYIKEKTKKGLIKIVKDIQNNKFRG